MKIKFISGLLFYFSILQASFGQTEIYTVTRAPFSSDKYDEFSPVFYRDGIVFCTNRSSNLLFNYSDSANRGQIKINYIDTTGSRTKAVLFSKSMTSRFNDGPVTFNRTGDTIYFSRNIRVEGKLKENINIRNRLGVFYSVLDEDEWIRTRELRYNSEWYNITTPSLSPDGKKLYFASDKPDGYGGSDLYYCQWMGDFWDEPVNLGPVINTAGNEAYPFINPAGELFFSSDGHPGLGGKDIFFSRLTDSVWITPVGLSEPINSGSDDFGIVTDTLMNKGYFSSDRGASLDIYEFKTLIPQVLYSNIQKENQYCFIFSDTGLVEVDTINLRYKWNFGDGKDVYGAVVTHCFNGPGRYPVKLDIVERGTENLYFSKLSYTLEIKDFEQPFISSPDASITGDAVGFDGLKSYLPGYRIESWFWDFGDGTREQGEKVSHIFRSEGDYMVNLGLVIRSESSGLRMRTGISKKIKVVADAKARDSYLAGKASLKTSPSNIKEYSNAHILLHYSDEDEIRQNAVFTIQILSSPTRLDLNSARFRALPVKYRVKEYLDRSTGIYSYTAGQHMELIEAYISYRELHALGFRETRIKIRVLTEPVERELYNLMRIYGVNTDLYFDKLDRLTSHSYIMLDQIVNLLNKNTGSNLEVIVHSDNTGSLANNLSVTQKRAQSIVNYLVKRGISAKRLVPTGFGGSLPIAPNMLEKDRKLNRRIDFVLIN